MTCYNSQVGTMARTKKSARKGAQRPAAAASKDSGAKKESAAATKSVTLDEKVDLVLKYYHAEGKWPVKKFRDHTTGFPLGKFCHSLRRKGLTKLTTEQQTKLTNLGFKTDL